MNCQTCTNPTKYPIGFWDGENSHGGIFDCHNSDCEVKQAKLKLDELIKNEKEEVDGINSANGISIEIIKDRRRELGITIAKIAKSLGISPSEYSCYEQCREPLPVEMIDKIDGVFSKAVGETYTASRSWTIRFRNKGMSINA